MKLILQDVVLRALTEASRAPGWNNRSREIRRFILPGNFGRDCTLYVVPYRRFAYHRQELGAACWCKQDKPTGTAA